MEQFLAKKIYKNGEIGSDVIAYFYNKYNPTNVLFIRTPTTGAWFDNLLLKQKKIDRILYKTNIKTKTICHKSTKILNNSDLKSYIELKNKKYDLIGLDGFHTYTQSKLDLELLSSFLSDDGIIICHDCFPPHVDWANSEYVSGNWCGQSYLAFIEFSYNHPEFFYCLINSDTGIGIISKKMIETFSHDFNRENQLKLINLINKGTVEPYEFFKQNCSNLMNIIQ